MNKIIVVNKPSGFTSHDVVNKLRKIFKTKRVGHTGTLDPDATGVLVVCLNEATKLVQFLEADSKEYIAEVLIGKSTDTYDLSGNVIEEKEVENLSNSQIDEVLKNFTGKITQIPPIYSAIKVNGKKLYEYARNNQTVELPKREVEIFELERLTDVSLVDGYYTFKLRCFVSKGTYIRSLCFDIANLLGYPGLMKSLIRTKSGAYSLSDAATIEEIENSKFTSFDMLSSLKNYDIIDEEDFIHKASHGMKISINKVYEILNKKPNQFVIKNNDILVAIYELDLNVNCYRAVRVWN
jgi:tRNA pseudouridine55 synthase